VLTRTRGLPPTADRKRINNICKNHYDSTVLVTFYEQISGWKPTGAYRVFTVLKNGKRTSLIYKNEDFSKENIPALDGFPIMPGKIEYLLYSSPHPPNNILPKAYHVEKTNFHTYQYYFEDLNRQYKRIDNRDYKSIYHAAKKIRKMNQYLDDWRKKYNINDFPIYNLEFRKKAQNYALQNFQRYYSKKPHAAFKKVLNEWDKISDVYVNYLKSDNEKLTTIHGDYNRTNLWIDKNNGNTLKIVDWEWSGIGLSHLDLASLLIGQPKHIEKEAMLEFTKSQGEYTLKENQEHYTFSKLERAILDCSYVTGIDLSIKRKSRFNLNTFAINASLRILEAYSEMK